jgi:probable RNA-binding protein EIF1AD
MPKPRRKIQETANAASTPPEKLQDGQYVAKVVKISGNNLYDVVLPDTTQMLVELAAKFRSTIWMRRGGYVLIDTKAFEHRDNKLEGEIVNVVRDEKLWRKQSYWYKMAPMMLKVGTD